VNLPQQWRLLRTQHGYQFVRIRNAAEKVSQCVQSLTISAKLGGVRAVLQRWIPKGETIWIADAHRDDGKRFVVHVDDEQYFETIFLIVFAPRTVNAGPRIFSRGTVENSAPFCFLRRRQ
jgi:predicted metal-dependent enzyme (double-stranded beta helix superfamily)